MNTIVKPTLLLNTTRAIRNIEKMIAKAARNNARFRPHFKTPQSAEIGEWFRERGVSAITVSSIEMARYFAEHGWNDICIAFPVNLREIDKLNHLAQRIRLHLLVESAESVAFLADNIRHPVHLWIKIDTGYHRTGLLWEETEGITALVRQIETQERLRFQGILTHSGHTYKARSHAEVRDIYRDTITKMQTLRDQLNEGGFSAEISIGDTPTCSIVENLSAADEIRPGNFVFYDAMQLQIGSCTEQDIAVAAACPVVAKHQARRELILYGGAVHLSKEALVSSPDNIKIYGRIALPQDRGWGPILPNAYVAGLSQEHGIVKVPQTVFERVAVGDLLMVIPVHSCLTANLLRKYITLDGKVFDIANLC